MNIFKEFFRLGGAWPPTLEKLRHYEKGSLVSFRPRAPEIYGPALVSPSLVRCLDRLVPFLGPSMAQWFKTIRQSSLSFTSC
jgi:hypothetical protein